MKMSSWFSRILLVVLAATAISCGTDKGEPIPDAGKDAGKDGGKDGGKEGDGGAGDVAIKTDGGEFDGGAKSDGGAAGDATGLADSSTALVDAPVDVAVAAPDVASDAIKTVDGATQADVAVDAAAAQGDTPVLQGPKLDAPADGTVLGVDASVSRDGGGDAGDATSASD
jgi:hypothetical protein